MKLAKYLGIGAIGAAVTIAAMGMGMGRSAATAPAVQAPMAEGAYAVDPVHSSVVFRIQHNKVSYFYGRFDSITGSFAIDPSDAGKNSIDVSIETESVDTHNQARDKHLKSPDFFSASEFPAITFKSKGWKPLGKVDGEDAFDVVGDLTLLGKTKEITLNVRHTGTGKGGQGKELAGLEAKFTIKRSDFGMTKFLGGPLGDDVTLMVAVEGGR